MNNAIFLQEENRVLTPPNIFENEFENENIIDICFICGEEIFVNDNNHSFINEKIVCENCN